MVVVVVVGVWKNHVGWSPESVLVGLGAHQSSDPVLK